MGSHSLTNVLYFLAFGLVFYWMMMRDRSCIHAYGGRDHAALVRSAHAGRDEQHADVSGSTRDLVGAMPVDPKRAVGMRPVRERAFCFYSSLAPVARPLGAVSAIDVSPLRTRADG